MIRALESEEVERVLRTEIVGRIGCHAGDRTYIVPVSYVYQDGSVYAHSSYGQKIEMMRENPEVCFEVDHVEDLGNWNSAI
jgi:nitroimidazol reductase NimA-like FMN-containing flavoprotein (pyridoxamine 5'-phosphate oxidase superfamily)